MSPFPQTPNPKPTRDMVANPEQLQEAVFTLDARVRWFHITECVSVLFCRAKCEQGGADRTRESRGGNHTCIILHPKPEGSLRSEVEEARIQSMLEKLERNRAAREKMEQIKPEKKPSGEGQPNWLNPDRTDKEWQNWAIRVWSILESIKGKITIESGMGLKQY